MKQSSDVGLKQKKGTESNWKWIGSTYSYQPSITNCQEVILKTSVKDSNAKKSPPPQRPLLLYALATVHHSVALSTLCRPCLFFAPAAIIAADLLHDLKPLRSHLPTSGRLFAIVDPSILCTGSRNKVRVEANKTRDSLDTHELHPLDKRRNGMYGETEFTRRAEGHGRKERDKVTEDDDKSPFSPALS